MVGDNAPQLIPGNGDGLIPADRNEGFLAAVFTGRGPARFLVLKPALPDHGRFDAGGVINRVKYPLPDGRGVLITAEGVQALQFPVPGDSFIAAPMRAGQVCLEITHPACSSTACLKKA